MFLYPSAVSIRRISTTKKNTAKATEERRKCVIFILFFFSFFQLISNDSVIKNECKIFYKSHQVNLKKS